MKKLSTGQDSTFRNWITLSEAVFGADSAPVVFLKQRANKEERGLDTEIISDEGQLLQVLATLALQEYSKNTFK